MKKIGLILISTLVVCSIAKAQFSMPGEVDTIFNFLLPNVYYQNGHLGGTAIDGSIEDFAKLSDGKWMVFGGFSTYNQTTQNKVATIFENGFIHPQFSSTGFDDVIFEAVTQPDDKIIAVGAFTNYNGFTANRVVRFNKNGSVDTAFMANIGDGANGYVMDVALQTDGKIVLVGDFQQFNNQNHNRIIRLSSNGTVDNTFTTGIGLNDVARAVAVNLNNKIFVGGFFSQYNGNTANSLVAINPNGTIFTAFDHDTGFNNGVLDIIPLKNGKIAVGGWFTQYQGFNANRFIVLDSMGKVPATFVSGAGVSGNVFALSELNNGHIAVGGSFNSSNSVNKRALTILNQNGLNAPNFHNSFGGISGTVFAIDTLSNGNLLVGGSISSVFGNPVSSIVSIKTNGIRDSMFNYTPGFSAYGATAEIKSVSALGNGKILATGTFDKYNGKLARHIARLLPTGDIDTSFVVKNGTNGYINKALTLSDGKMIVAGSFTQYNGVACNNIVRLLENGLIDQTFNATVDAEVITICLLPSGKIAIGGSFTMVNNVYKPGIAILNSNGTLDNTFASGDGIVGTVHAIALNGNNLLVGGLFSNYNSVQVPNLVEVNLTGGIVNTFSVGGANDLVKNFMVQPDGKIIVVGAFTQFNGTMKNSLVRLNANGTTDASFVTGLGLLAAANNTYANKVLLQADGKILVAGDFINYNGNVAIRLLRINPNGTIDPTFNALMGANDMANDMAIDTDGKLIVAGKFTQYRELGRGAMAKVNLGSIVTNTRLKLGSGGKSMIYPNPAKNGFFVEVNNNSEAEILLYDVMGKKISEQTAQNGDWIDVADFNKGIYFVKVVIGDNLEIHKLLIRD